METTRKSVLSEQAADYIRNRIVTGEITAGERIIEADLSQLLGMSRGPIREALKILENEGLVQYENNRGCTAVFLSPEDTWEIFFLRGSLEKISLEECNGRIPKFNLIVMKEALDTMSEQSDNIIAVVEADEIFHREIVKACGIKRLLMLWQSMSNFNLAMFYSGIRTGAFNVYNQYEKHVQLYQILEQGDLELSTKAITDHYTHTGDRIYKMSRR